MSNSRRTDKRHVAVVTGSRAEFGLLEPVLRAMQSRPGLDPKLIVTGMHLVAKFGRTVDQIRAAGWSVDATVKMQTGRDDPRGEPQAVARGIAGIAEAVGRLRAEVVLVLGDRIEAFAGAAAGACARKVVAHIHGGDRAPGDVDEALRNAITRLAHVHLAASRAAADRLRRMGEPASRIHRVGAPGLDGIRELRQAERGRRAETDRWLRRKLGAIADDPYAVVVQHPAGETAEAEEAGMYHVLEAVGRCGLGGVVLYPNSDPGHSGIIRAIRQINRRPSWRVFRSLPREEYLRMTMQAAVLVGNSSSGIIESASLGVPAVNVGPRQAGRLRCGRSVVDAAADGEAIARAIWRALALPRPRPGASVYGDGRAGPRVARVVERLIITPDLLHKRLTY